MIGKPTLPVVANENVPEGTYALVGVDPGTGETTGITIHDGEKIRVLAGAELEQWKRWFLRDAAPAKPPEGER